MPTGPQKNVEPPPGPPGVGPVRDCVSPYTRINKEVPFSTNPLPKLGSGHHLLGAKTTDTEGIWGSIEVKDPDVPAWDAQDEDLIHFVTSFFSIDGSVSSGGKGMEVGWVECNYEHLISQTVECNDNQIVFVAWRTASAGDFTLNTAVVFNDSYELIPDTEYSFTISHDGGPVWIAYIWWCDASCAWQELTSKYMPGEEASISHSNWEF